MLGHRQYIYSLFQCLGNTSICCRSKWCSTDHFWQLPPQQVCINKLETPAHWKTSASITLWPGLFPLQLLWYLLIIDLQWGQHLLLRTLWNTAHVSPTLSGLITVRYSSIIWITIGIRILFPTIKKMLVGRVIRSSSDIQAAVQLQ